MLVLKPDEDPVGGSPAEGGAEVKGASGGITGMLQSSWRVLPSVLLADPRCWRRGRVAALDSRLTV